MSTTLLAKISESKYFCSAIFLLSSDDLSLFIRLLHPSSDLTTCADLWLGIQRGMTSWDEKQQEATKRRFPSKRKLWMENMKTTGKVAEQQMMESTWSVWVPAVRLSKTHATLRKDEARLKEKSFSGHEIEGHKLTCQRKNFPCDCFSAALLWLTVVHWAVGVKWWCGYSCW